MSFDINVYYLLAFANTSFANGEYQFSIDM